MASLATFTFNLGRCPAPPSRSILLKTIANLVTDTQAAIFRDDNAKDLILSFPGAAFVQDFVTAFSFIALTQTAAAGCTDCKVHGGFYIAWRSIADEVTIALADLRSKNPEYSTIITGHSLGGAIATLAYTDLKAAGAPVKTGYTMGSPRVGNPAYADFVDRLSGASDSDLGMLIRITHSTDGVPDCRLRRWAFSTQGRRSMNWIMQRVRRVRRRRSDALGRRRRIVIRGRRWGLATRITWCIRGIQMTNEAKCANAN